MCVAAQRMSDAALQAGTQGPARASTGRGARLLFAGKAREATCTGTNPTCPALRRRRFKGSLRHGSGAAVEKGLYVYKGPFAFDARHGAGGECSYSDGSKYTGDWFEDRRHGRGRMELPDGTVYEGDWRDDARHGEGGRSAAPRCSCAVWFCMVMLCILTRLLFVSAQAAEAFHCCVVS